MKISVDRVVCVFPFKNLILLTLISACLAACASSGKVDRPDFPYDYPSSVTVDANAGKSEADKNKKAAEQKDPEVAPGFLIQISNLEDRKLNGSFRVDFDGHLKLPYNVNLMTTGLSFSALSAKIQSSYRKFFQTDSAFAVVLSKREYWIEVRGLVEKTGRVLISSSDGIDRLILDAGGLKKDPAPKYLKVRHRDGSEDSFALDDYFKSGTGSGDIAWQGGEVVFFQIDPPAPETLRVSKLPSIQLMGEVAKPGLYSYEKGKDIYHYLGQAGGPMNGADLSHIRIVRGPANNRVMIAIDSLEEGKRPVLLPGDLILVPYDRPNRFERNITTGAGIATILSVVVLLITVL
jgi:protein involved in polysaccharide export with SLBB domain